MLLRTLSLSLLGLALAPVSGAQEILLEYQPNGSTTILDSQVDVDGDGVFDLLAAGLDPSLTDEQISILSGASGLPLLELVDPIDDQGGPVLLDGHFVGDLDDDGWVDFVLATPPADLLFFSSRTGVKIDTLSLPSLGGGLNIALLERLPDLDGDGFDEIALVQLDLSSGSSVDVVSSGSRSVLWSRSFDHFGLALCPIEDQDADGVEDLLFPAPSHPDLWVLSSSDGSTLDTISTGVSSLEDIQRVHDVDGDGAPDVLLGPSLELLSGADLGKIATLDPGLPNLIVSTALFYDQDVNGDGVDDFGLVAFERIAAGEQLRTALLISGRSLELMHREVLGSTALWPIQTGAGDLDQDGQADIVELVLDDALQPVIRVRAGQELSLLVDDLSPTAGTRLRLRVAEGGPGALAAIVITAVDDLPFTRLYALGPMDAGGALQRRPTVPPGLAGISVDFIGYADRPDGFRATDPVRMELE